MRRKITWYLILLLFTYVFIGPAALNAETAYVSDMLILTLREGPGREHNVIKTLKSNDAVEILKEGDKYYNVRLSSGETGWVQKQYITFELPSTRIVARLKEKTARLEQQNSDLEKENSRLAEQFKKEQQQYQARIEALETSLEKATEKNRVLSGEKNKTKEQYETLVKDASNIVTIKKKNKRLQQENAELLQQVQSFRGEGKNLLKTGFIKWFLAGGGVLLFGWLIGRSMSGRSKKRSRGLLD
ncbi:MAG: TIGR04211 family SH3 domain-containing protein [Desulfobacteraceae bacterium]